MVQFVENDDAAYGSWLGRSDDNYVANLYRTKRPNYFLVHSTSCRIFTSGSSRNNGPGAFTGNIYRKVGAATVEELIAWAELKGFDLDRITYCGTCLKGEGRSRRRKSPSEPVYPDEISAPPETYPEGGTKQVTVNAYERNPKARRRCLKHHGHRCSVCDLDMGERYGDLGKGYIHVHHVKPLAEIKKRYEVDPIEDLRPVCPNCHAMLHAGNPPTTIDELRAILSSS